MYDKVVICFSNRIIELSLVKSAESLNNELTMLLCPQIFIPFNENSLWSRNSTSPIINDNLIIHVSLNAWILHSVCQ